jgi:2-amino-4-hydroxy-6-hydroxymethyldihydropteridine diphosphokinase
MIDLDSIMPDDVYIAMGSNLGDRSANIQGGIESIGLLDSTSVIACASIIETEPVGPGEQGRYLNTVVEIRTSLEPRALLQELLAIEARHGRERSAEIRWGARTLDLDIVLFGDRVVNEPGLSIPHPSMHLRSFVLEPLCELAADLHLPLYQKTPRALLGALEESMNS